MAQLERDTYSLVEKAELKAAVDNNVLMGALQKFCSQQAEYFKESSYEAAENDLRKADRQRGMATAYEDLVREFQQLVRRLLVQRSEAGK